MSRLCKPTSAVAPAISTLIKLFSHDSSSHHCLSNGADPRLLVGRIVCNEVKDTVGRVHSERVLFASLIVCGLHCGALAQANCFGWIAELSFLLESAQVIWCQDAPTSAPVLEMQGLLRKPPLLNDVRFM